MDSLCYICLLYLFSVGFLKADPQLISARVGSTAVLPCEWRNRPVPTQHVQWSTVSDTVFERNGVELFEAEGYKNRVDVPHENLLNGNCSLMLKSIRLTDAGVYKSYIYVKHLARAHATRWILAQTVSLSVDEPPEETLHDFEVFSESHEEHFHERLTANAGLICPQPVIILCSLLTCLHHFLLLTV